MSIQQYIATHWLDWAFALITAFAGFGYRNVALKLKEERKKNEAIANGLQSLLRQSIVDSYNRYQDKGFCPIYAKETLKTLYQSYHELGGNDVATKLYNTILQMPEEKEDVKKNENE